MIFYPTYLLVLVLAIDLTNCKCLKTIILFLFQWKFLRNFKVMLCLPNKLFLSGELKLQIKRNVESFYTPVADVVEEKAGTNFSLLCELVSSDATYSTEFDDQITWVKETANLKWVYHMKLFSLLIVFLMTLQFY